MHVNQAILPHKTFTLLKPVCHTLWANYSIIGETLSRDVYMIIKELELNPKTVAAVMRMEGYKQKDIAKAIGVTTRTIQKWFK